MFARCCFICLFLQLVVKVSLQDTPVIGFVGGSVTLPCSYKEPLEPEKINVFWRFNTSKTVYNIEKGKKTENPDSMFTGRITAFDSEFVNGNFSLILSNLKLTDAGQYVCDIPDVGKKHTVLLQVRAMPTTSPPTKPTPDTGSSSMKAPSEWIVTFLTAFLLILHYIGKIC